MRELQWMQKSGEATAAVDRAEGGESNAFMYRSFPNCRGRAGHVGCFHQRRRGLPSRGIPSRRLSLYDSYYFYSCYDNYYFFRSAVASYLGWSIIIFFFNRRKMKTHLENNCNDPLPLSLFPPDPVERFSYIFT